jgi:hypothetical protein
VFCRLQDGSSALDFALEQNHPRIAEELRRWERKYSGTTDS